MSMFSPQQRRDAHAVVRGFTYQVDRTILAWLDVDEDTILFCECGEDIDYVCHVFDEESGESIQKRLLEQVKLRECAPLSLRSHEIIEALANFLTLRSANHAHQLTFRFFTNTVPAKEREVTFPGNLSGLEAWQQAREGKLDPGELDGAVERIREVISQQVARETYSSGHARIVRDFLASADNQQVLQQLIGPVEWAMGNEEPQELQPIAEARLLELGYAQSPPEAKELFQCLFAYVFRKLGSPGEKRLDKYSLLEIVRQRTLTSGDRELLNRMWAFLRETEGKIEAVGTEVTLLRTGQAEMKAQMSSLNQAIERLVQRSIPFKQVPQTTRRVIRDDPVLQTAMFAPRETLSRSIDEKLRQHVCVTLVASAGMGKTQLAVSLWKRRGDAYRSWISLRGDRSRLPYHIDDQLLLWCEEVTGDGLLRGGYSEGHLSAEELTRSVAAIVGENALLIVDDLPDLVGESMTIERLAMLGVALRDVGGRLLITTQHPPPEMIPATLGTDVCMIPVPPMDKNDVKSILSVAGSPSYLQGDNTCSLLLGLTKGHPILITATVRWLQRNEWRLDNQRLEDLLSGEPIAEVREETRTRVRRLVDDDLTRHLLDRLSIVGSPFGADTVLAVANTEPIIERGKERFDELVGPWIQPLQGSRFEISPLLDYSWKTYISPELQQRLHSVLSRQYLGRVSITAADALSLCIHLFGAKEWQTLAHFLMNFMWIIKNAQEAKQAEWARWLFAPDQGWPSALSTGERIIIRTLQLRLFVLCGKPSQEYESDLEQLISEAKAEDGPVVALARFHLATVLAGIEPEVIARRAIEAARALREIEDQLDQPPPESLELLFWGATTKPMTLEQIHSLLKTIRELTDLERKILFTSKPGPEMSALLADQCYAVEADKDAACRNWDAVLLVLGALEEVGQLDGAEPLFAASLRVRAIVLADFLDRTFEGLQVLEQAPYDRLTEGSRFLLTFTRASILLTKDRVPEAYEYFEKSLSIPEGQEYLFFYYEGLKRGMQAAAQAKRWDRAKTWCIDAMRKARGENLSDPYEYWELLGELAWIHWCSGHRKKAYAAMHAIVYHLASVTETDNTRYKETFFKVGHVLGWLVSVATKGEPPSVTLEGEPYTTPYHGMFYHRAPAMAELPMLPRVDVLLSQLAIMASGVGCLRLAKEAYLMASKVARDDGFSIHAAAVDLERASIESYLGDFEAAFAAVLAGIRAVPLIRARPQGVLDLKDDLTKVWEQVSETERVLIENSHIFHIVILPAFARLLERDVDRATAFESVERIQLAMVSIQKQLLKYDQWQHLTKQMKLAFDGDSRSENVLRALRELEPDNNYERFVLYMTLACQCDAMPAQISNAQAVILTHLGEFKKYHDIAIQSISRWIVEFWHKEAASRGFRLNSPQLFRQALATVPKGAVCISDAAGVLLAAQTAAGTAFDGAVRAKLREMVGERNG